MTSCMDSGMLWEAAHNIPCAHLAAVLSKDKDVLAQLQLRRQMKYIN